MLHFRYAFSKNVILKKGWLPRRTCVTPPRPCRTVFIIANENNRSVRRGCPTKHGILLGQISLSLGWNIPSLPDCRARCYLSFYQTLCWDECSHNNNNKAVPGQIRGGAKNLFQQSPCCLPPCFPHFSRLLWVPTSLLTFSPYVCGDDDDQNNRLFSLFLSFSLWPCFFRPFHSYL